MAGADYTHCEKCSKRVFYDADLYSSERFEDVGQLAVLCKECAKSRKLVVVQLTREERRRAR